MIDTISNAMGKRSRMANDPRQKFVSDQLNNYSAKRAAAGQDIGKPGKNFAKIAASAGKEYGSEAAGKRVAGAVLNKLRHRGG
jgi:hypothetical protein